ncbi:MAG: DUF4123 domain-containing protein [Thiobacillus sp.]|nr:DUF4123 domain-containing protein [Thiobacillus sp.]
MKKFSDFMGETLVCPAVPNMHRYLMIDTSATRPVNVGRSLPLGGSSVDLLTGRLCDWRKCANPVLLELPDAAFDEQSISAASSFFETWHFANCFTFIESSLNWSSTLLALRTRTVAVLPDHVPVMLRFYDARILPVLLRVLSPEQRHQFLGIARRWAFPGRKGELCLIESDESLHDSYPTPLSLTPDQEAALIDAAEVDAMVDLLLNTNNPTLAAALPPEQHELIEAALSSANSLKIRQGSDQVAYCTLYLELGPDFMTQDPWRSWLPDMTVGKLTLSDVMNLAMEASCHE